MLRWRQRFGVLVLGSLSASPGAMATDKPPAPMVVIVVASQGHGGALHEHRATARLLADWVNKSRATSPVRTLVMDEERARRPRAFDDASSVVLLGDEGDSHILNDAGLRANVAELVERRGGLVLVHGSAVPPDDLAKDVRAWVGGVARSERAIMSVNWPAGFGQLPSHPILDGIAPFSVDDRWLPAVHLNGAENVTPLLRADPPEYAHIAGEPNPQTMAWLFERSDGGRSFVYGGGHFLESYRDANLRQVLTRAIIWTTRIDLRRRVDR